MGQVSGEMGCFTVMLQEGSVIKDDGGNTFAWGRNGHQGSSKYNVLLWDLMGMCTGFRCVEWTRELEIMWTTYTREAK